MADRASSSYYDRYWKAESWATRPPLKLVELFENNVSERDHTLDVGCGDGGTCGVWLAAHAANYVGVDVSEAAVEMARARGLDARRIVEGAALPFTNDTFDVAVCVEVMEHLFEPQLALHEIRRVLRPGGRLILTVPNAAHWRNRLDLTMFGRWNPRGDHLSATEPWRDAHLRFFTMRSLASLAETCGFNILERGGYVEHSVSHYVPGLRRVTGRSPANRAVRRIAELYPRLLAGNIYLVTEA